MEIETVKKTQAVGIPEIRNQKLQVEEEIDTVAKGNIKSKKFQT